jgi:hypothetical protein
LGLKLVALFLQYFSLGFGPAFQSTELLALLDEACLNRRHNDWLETAMALGVFGIPLTLASTVNAILGIASQSDSPLPADACRG